MKFLPLLAFLLLPCLPSCGCGSDSVPPPPSVLQASPEDGSGDVALDGEICVTFSDAMAGVNASTFQVVERGGSAVTGTIVLSGDGAGACFIPSSEFLPCTTYDIVVGAAVVDGFGQHLSAFASSFTTTGVNCPPAPTGGQCLPSIDLGTAEPYAVLAGSTVTNAGTSTLDGDLGLSPGSSVTGAPSVTGTTHIADAVAVQAQLDLITAYNAAAAAPSTATRIGDIGGEILTAGVYTSSSTLAVSSADLVLVGGPDDVFIFQMVSSLTIGSGRKILLQGVRPCNVIWQVGSSAVLDTGVQFAGTILALTDITLKTGTTAVGRMLARNGQVVLDTNTVTVP